MEDAYAAATKLLSACARQVAEEDVHVGEQRLGPEPYTRASTARRLMHNLIEPAPNQGYQPLAIYIRKSIAQSHR